MKKRNISVWYGRIEDAAPFPDVLYWRSRSDDERFEAAWQMVVDAHELKGEDLRESRLQRSIGGLRKCER
jgi:hypothetical protein